MFKKLVNINGDSIHIGDLILRDDKTNECFAMDSTEMWSMNSGQVIGQVLKVIRLGTFTYYIYLK